MMDRISVHFDTHLPQLLLCSRKDWLLSGLKVNASTFSIQKNKNKNSSCLFPLNLVSIAYGIVIVELSLSLRFRSTLGNVSWPVSHD
ncbi:Uncharacterized protein TCM_017270 [Theobroma cacao]|uniref:Uncharacterized protein n=1 Tax=Theobroma cacao TaxID=3641 RepID=A0A061ED53_THECC|nr:Uncharacterized protein TCM_017270 [Theobroma cacao]